jgi:hypothetical protein
MNRIDLNNNSLYQNRNINLTKTRVMAFENNCSSYLPTSFKQYQNYPNPYNPMTTLRLDKPPIKSGPPAHSGGLGVFHQDDDLCMNTYET